MGAPTISGLKLAEHEESDSKVVFSSWTAAEGRIRERLDSNSNQIKLKLCSYNLLIVLYNLFTIISSCESKKVCELKQLIEVDDHGKGFSRSQEMERVMNFGSELPLI